VGKRNRHHPVKAKRVVLFFLSIGCLYIAEHYLGDQFAAVVTVFVGLFHGTDVADTILG
jgi:hypothetical protein